MTEAYINGIRQIPGIDFVSNHNSISFSQAPKAGSSIQFVHNGYSIANVKGDGSTFLFTGPFANADKSDAIYDTMHTALRHMDNPAVADALERLRVVVELVKE